MTPLLILLQMLKLTLKAPTAATSSTGNNATSSLPQQTPKITINLSTANSNSKVKPTLPPCALEEHFILRLPPSLASLLRGSLVESEFTSPGDLKIRFLTGRTALVQHPRFIKPGYPAILCDSPSIMETLKNPSISIDHSNDNHKVQTPSTSTSENSQFTVGQYYKVADLNQILVVLDVDSPEGQRTLTSLPSNIQQRLLRIAASPDSFDTLLQGIPAAEQAEESHSATLPWCSLPDGLTAPLKSAQKRRFAPRPLHASRVGDLERVEREVERLLKEDASSGDSQFTLVGPDGKVLLGNAELEETEQDLLDEFNDDDDGDFQEEGEGEEEEEEMDDFAAEIEDNLMRLDEESEEGEGEAEGTTTSTTFTTTTTNTITITTSPTTNVQDPSSPSSTQPTLSSAVTELELKLQEKLKQAATVTNPLIKARIEDVIRQLEDNLRKLREVEEQ